MQGMQHLNVIPLVELCTCHGVQLSKDRAPICKELATAACSLSKQFRHKSFYMASRNGLLSFVGARGRVRRCARPPHVVALQKVLFETLYGDRNSKHFWVERKKKGGGVERRKSRFLEYLDAAIAHTDFDERDDGSWRVILAHWCYVEDLPVGIWRCRHAMGNPMLKLFRFSKLKFTHRALHRAQGPLMRSQCV